MKFSELLEQPRALVSLSEICLFSKTEFKNLLESALERKIEASEIRFYVKRCMSVYSIFYVVQFTQIRRQVENDNNGIMINREYRSIGGNN